jgi:hypothetical protein
VVVTRPTELEELLARHATRGQAAFFLEQRDQDIGVIEADHARVHDAVAAVSRAIPIRWRRARLGRAELSRFVFEPGDIVVAVGQDGLVANVAKYLDGQLVVGVNPDPRKFDGVLVRHPAKDVRKLLPSATAERLEIEERTMVSVELDDGQRLVALNEIYLGHRTHQSSRYRLAWAGATERHSSSGLICATGTGATGWARSICLRRDGAPPLPGPGDPAVAFLVREAFPSRATGTELVGGVVPRGDRLEVRSEMNHDGVIFGDGIEADRIDFHWGMTATVGVARRSLRLAA